MDMLVTRSTANTPDECGANQGSDSLLILHSVHVCSWLVEPLHRNSGAWQRSLSPPYIPSTLQPYDRDDEKAAVAIARETGLGM